VLWADEGFEIIAVEVKGRNPNFEVQSKSNAYIFIVTVQELLLQPR